MTRSPAWAAAEAALGVELRLGALYVVEEPGGFLDRDRSSWCLELEPGADLAAWEKLPARRSVLALVDVLQQTWPPFVLQLVGRDPGLRRSRRLVPVARGLRVAPAPVDPPAPGRHL